MEFVDSIIRTLRSAWESIDSLFSDREVCSPMQGCGTLPKKTVSEKAKERLNASQEAINYAKTVFAAGAGNQKDALEKSDFNTYFRMQAARDNSAFNIPPKVEELASKNPAAFLAAKAELTQGGNCGEHAYVVYDYLRRKYPEEQIQISQKAGFDHAFVIIGDVSTDSATDLVVADAWPTNPTPVLWEDHFAYTSDPGDLLIHAKSKGDDRDYRQEMFDEGLELSPRGNDLVQKTLTKKETSDKINDGLRGWVWQHPDTAKTKYDYVTMPSM